MNLKLALSIAAGIVIGVLGVAIVLGLAHHSSANACVERTLRVSGYSPAGITAALKVYSSGGFGPADSPSPTEIMWARGVCGLNP